MKGLVVLGLLLLQGTSAARPGAVAGLLHTREGAPAAAIRVSALPAPPPNIRPSDGQNYYGATTPLSTTVTDAQGRFRINDVLPGDYIVREVQRPGFTQTEPANGAGFPVTVIGNQITFGVVFGNRSAVDWGDAPASYGTLSANNGARHGVLANFFLGDATDTTTAHLDDETNGIPSPDADGDDLSNTDDEDGVLFLTPIVPGEQATIRVDVSSGPFGSGFLQGWIDFSNDTILPDGRGAAFDLQPLNMTGSTTTVVAGSSLSGLHHLAANGSNGSANRTDWTFRVYLSTNSDISASDTLISTQVFSWNFGPVSSVTLNMLPVTIPGGTAAGRPPHVMFNGHQDGMRGMAGGNCAYTAQS